MALYKLLMCTKQIPVSNLNVPTCLRFNLQQPCLRNYGLFQRRNPSSTPWKSVQEYIKRNGTTTLSGNSNNTAGRNKLSILRRFFTSSYGRGSNKPAANVKNGSKNSKISSQEMKRLISLIKPEKWNLTGALLCLILSSCVSLAVPYFIGKIIDIIYTEHSHGGEMLLHLKTFCLTLLVVFIIGGMANFGRVYILQTASQRIVSRLREMLFTRIIRQEVGFFDKTKTGELINRLSADTSVMAQSLSQNISDGLRALIQASAGMGMMAYVSPKLTMISMGIVPPVAVASIIYGRYLRQITKNVQDSLADATDVAEEKINNIRTVKAFAHEEMERKAYREGIQRVLELAYQEALARAIFWGFTGFSGNVIIISILYFGGFMMMDASITVGDLSSFLLYAAYVGASMGGLTTFYTELNRGIAASHRVWQLIDRKPSLVEQSSTGLAKVDGNFVFDNVSFHYPARPDAQIFSDLNMEIPAGKITALVGPSGSGKSTVGHLLLRFYDPTAGMVLLDGHNIQDLDSSFLRSKIGLVSQEPVLFSTTIMENIAYGAPAPHLVTEDEVMAAAIKANVASFIKEFPQGMDTIVGQRGKLLSGGQRQRIAIARAIVKNPKILVLDEATSALDAESEFLVQDALEQLMVGRTVLIIAHRLSTIMNADNIVVIDKGQLAEAGTYQELMLSNGLFRKLVDRQTLSR